LDLPLSCAVKQPIGETLQALPVTGGTLVFGWLQNVSVFFKISRFRSKVGSGSEIQSPPTQNVAVTQR